MLNRYFSELGVAPILGYLFFGGLFFIGSFILFSRTPYAIYIYPFVAIACLSYLSETNRNDFLKSVFLDKDYQIVRVLENSLLVLPFCGFLLYQSQFLVALLLLLSSSIFAFININQSLNYTLPTPFYKLPFEFTVGFRKTFFAFPLIYFLTYKAIEVGNFNLGAFSLLLIYAVCMSFYIEAEKSYFVWIFAETPKEFLMQKMKTGLLYSTLLGVPVLLSLGFFFPIKIPILLGIMALGYLYLLMILLAKYSKFPHKISLPQSIIMFFAVGIPPLLLLIIPYFYSKSLQQLQQEKPSTLHHQPSSVLL